MLSTPHLHSSAVGPAPLNTPSAEWDGPTIIPAPTALVQSRIPLSQSTPLRRTRGSGLMGLASGLQTVTTVRSSPASSSRLPQSIYFFGWHSNAGSSTTS